VIQGLAISLESTALPAIVIVGGIISTYQLAGLFGTGIAVTAMLGIAGVIVALDAFGPVTDNAGGIAEMSGLPPEVRSGDRRARRRWQHHQGRHQGLRDRFCRSRCAGAVRGLFERPSVLCPQAMRSSTASVFQGYGRDLVRSVQPLRGCRPDLRWLAPVPVRRHCHDGSVGRAAGSIVEEVRRQFKEKPGIMEGTEKPDYGRAVDMLTKAAIRK
jgi:K(+)-stimulated pyrophosphate-energized sodium pump